MATKKYISFNNLTSFLDNLKSLFATKAEMSAKSDKTHTHAISDITNLQSTLNGKANSSHGTHVSYSSTTPVMDGTASVGSASTVARSDHKHPTDTSRAAQTSLDSHTSNTTSHITSAERSNWNTAYNHSQSAHAPSNAEANQNAFSNVKVGDTIIAADIKTDTLTLVAGNNITITPDATNDKITITAKDTTYSLGSFGITATAAELNKLDGVTASATEINYIDGVTSNIQTQLDNKAAKSHTHTVSNISDLTATATELNYMDGVTSSVQTQLDGKSSISHTHKYAGSASVGGSATSAVKLDTNTAGDANTPVYFSGGKPVACTSLDLNTSGSSASCTGNSATATKLQTARTIGLGTGATGTATSFDGTGNITIPVTEVKESYLSWGGKNLSGSVSPIDAACSNIHSANRFAFAKPDGITIEYSTNGSTYNTYSTTDSAKVNLVSGIGSTYYIGARNTSTTVNDKLRITLNATNMGLYTRLRKLLINISTSYATGSNVIIERAMKGSETTFTTIGTYQISGWSGWNSIPISSAFGGGATQTGNIAVLRLTFGITGVNSEQTSNALQISDIIGIGDTYWSYPSTMAKTGHIYTYDSSQNTTFPANVTATTFVGALSGNAATATTASKLGSSTVGSVTQPVYLNGGTATACTYTLGKSVPSNAVFTDANVTNTLSTTTKAYITGTTSATTNTGTQVFDTGVYLDTTAGQLTATTFNGTTFKGSGVATLAEVKTYLGI